MKAGDDADEVMKSAAYVGVLLALVTMISLITILGLQHYLPFKSPFLVYFKPFTIVTNTLYSCFEVLLQEFTFG